MFDKLFSLVSHDVGIDLGTANTLVLVRGKGIVIREPSVVARHKKTREILEIGTRAKRMLGKTPPNIEAIRPLRDGVIADFDATVSMLAYFIKKIHEGPGVVPKIPKPRVVIGIPSGVTEVERRAVREASLDAGAREAFLVEEPLAAAIGAGLPVTTSIGSLIVDIGAGTSDIAVISLGGIVLGRSIRVAGDKMDQAIMSYFRLKYSLLLGEVTAESVKIEMGSAIPQKPEKLTVVRGRDLETGLPRSMRVSGTEVREGILPILQQIVGEVEGILEETPPELTADIAESGIVLVGGGALIPGIDVLFREATKMPVTITQDPLTAVVRGCGKLLEDAALAKQVKLTRGR
ncbi:rod shape-determining protein [Candidatus Microgenomates bacterium]|nr:rod shape-determining protein [Candidatus Microgenomates bacterium]